MLKSKYFKPLLRQDYRNGKYKAMKGSKKIKCCNEPPVKTWKIIVKTNYHVAGGSESGKFLQNDN